MKQSAKRLLSSILALFFVVAAFVVFFNFVQPSYKNILKAKAEVASQAKTLNARKDVVKKVQQLRTIYEGSGDARLQASLALPLTPQMSEALAQLNGLSQIHTLSAQAYNVNSQFDTETSEEERRRAVQGGGLSLVRPTGELTFNVRLFGSYANIKKFLANLETNVRVFDVKSMSFQPSGKASEDNYLVELKVAAYFQQDKLPEKK